MSTKEKLIERFKQLPNDFSFDETIRLFAALGYSLFNKGKTSGSRVSFVKDEDVFDMHRPHPGSTVKIGTLKSILKYLNDKGLL